MINGRDDSSPFSNLRLILGGPGCGKTTRLLEIVEREMDAGVYPERIAFVTFTKAAANEASERAAARFGLDPEKDLPLFRTIHSLAYSILGLSREEVMSKRDWKRFAELVGEEISGYYDATEGPTGGGKPGDIMLRVVDYAATTMLSLREAWHELNEPVEWYRLKRFYDTLIHYKSEFTKMDFSDMLLTYIESGEPTAAEVAVIDEGQDLTKAQWKVVEKAFRNARRVYVGGDDDQAIYRWAGADVAHFLGLTRSPDILPVSHRLPPSIHAFSTRLSARILQRYSKTFRPREEAGGGEGGVNFATNIEHVPFRERSSGSTLVLARNGYHLRGVKEALRAQGLNYLSRSDSGVLPSHVDTIKDWERLRRGRELEAPRIRNLAKALARPVPTLKDLRLYSKEAFPEWPLERPWYEALEETIDRPVLDYYVSILRNGFKLSDPPTIRVDTIHSVKGAEADNVVILSDISYRTARSLEAAPDHEHRVFYVGVTRARQSLTVVLPTTGIFYRL